MRRARLIPALVLAAAALAGCYGSTEPATDVGEGSATFNGRGTTDNGPADVWFEWWPTALPSKVGSTKLLAQRIPGGASGPVSDDFRMNFFGGLEPATQYAYRLCGQDASASQAVCAQTRTFTTLRPAGDDVGGGYSETPGQSTGAVDAKSDPGDANPSGTVRLTNGSIGQYRGNVTCMIVHGRDAVIGSVGTTDFNNGPVPAANLLTLRDGGIAHNGDPTGGDEWGGTGTRVPAPPDCSKATFDGAVRSISTGGVYDAP